MLTSLLDSAVRSLLMGCGVWALLRITRVRDTRTETLIWTGVLIAALSMPLLSRHVPDWVLTVPHVRAVATAASVLDSRRMSSFPGEIATLPLRAGVAHPLRACLTAVYVLGFAACAIRLMMGLLLTVRLYRRATPVHANWAATHAIRATAAIKSPVSLAGVILLPEDYVEWSASMRGAVLAHEAAHIARGDFFVQFAALVHCAVFWFSPFAWWLQRKLALIAETASDEAAMRHMKDRATYAEILVELSRPAQKSPLVVAMARSSFLSQRVEHILSEVPSQGLNRPQRLLSVGLLLVLAIAVAGARTARGSIALTSSTAVADAANNSPTPASGKVSMKPAPAQAAHAAPVPHGPRETNNLVEPHGPRQIHEPREAPGRAQPQAAPTYDPRALLDPAYAPKPTYAPAATVVHAGREFYVRSTEKPVADVSVTYAMERQIH